MTDPAIDWGEWLARWDAQQEGYVPEREARFRAMFDAVDMLAPAAFVALDLASGPGSLSRRLLGRFAQARAIAVDMDPVMLALGRGALGTMDGRLAFVEADLSVPGWTLALGGTERVDVVLSSTALHWLWPEDLARVYRDLAELLAPGGLLLNADNMAYGPSRPASDRLARRDLDARWSDAAFAARGGETAEQWWEALAAEPSMAPLLAQRSALLATKERQAAPPDIDVHVVALRDAGFSEIATIWQQLSSRVVLAVR